LKAMRRITPHRISSLFMILVVITGLSGCSQLILPGSSPAPTKQSTQNGSPTQTSTAQTSTQAPTLALTPANTPAAVQKLTVWLPPQFDPTSGTPGSNLLKERLRLFSDQHAGLQIEVRVKSASGSGGLLDALTATSAAAPGALPDLIAFSRDDLEAGALKGLLYPYDTATNTPDDPDWYNFARQMGLVQGTPYGLPFAGDALVMLYRPQQTPVLPTSWAALLRQTGVVAFPAADPQALVTMALYISEGGQITDPQHRPVLTTDTLENALKIYETGVKSGMFPPWLTTYDTDAQAWQAFKDKRAAWVVTWVSQYLAELPADTSMIPFLPVNENSNPMTLATGWVWALGNPQPEQRLLSIELAKWLVQSDFLSKWTSAEGYLPPRPTSLAGWSDQSLQTLLSQVVISAQLRPANDLLASLGPVLRDAGLQVLKAQSDPVQAAQAASERLKGP
jgi:multiple sugar transport system substrate-binding protein